MSTSPSPQDSNNTGAARSYSAPAEADGTAPPTNAPVTTNAGRAAETFITQEVAEAKRSLLLTRIASAALTLFVVCYLGYITSRFKDSMQPANAAEIAHGIIAQRVEDNATQIAEDVKKRVPAMIEQSPDYVIKNLPDYRQKLENQVVGDISGYAAQNAPKLGEHLDDFLSTHKDEVKQMLDDGQNPAVTEKVGAQLEQEFMDSLKQTDAGGGESYRQKLDKSLKALQDIKQKMDKLAANKNLSPNDKKARRAVAILASKINEKTVAPAIAPIKNAASAATGAINNAVNPADTGNDAPAAAAGAAGATPAAAASGSPGPKASASPAASSASPTAAASPAAAPTVR